MIVLSKLMPPERRDAEAAASARAAAEVCFGCRGDTTEGDSGGAIIDERREREKVEAE